MKVRIRRWLLGLLLGLMVAVGRAPAQSTDSARIAIAPDDRSVVRVRRPTSDQLDRYRNDRTYRYDRDAPPPENPLARFFDWILRRIGQFLSSPAYQHFWQYVVLAVIAAVVIYLLMKAEIGQLLFPRKAQGSLLDYDSQVENIHEINFGAAISEAVEQRNFRLATRLLFLQTLKQLNDAGLIQHKPDKTNRQYVQELTGQSFQGDFETLARQFDFVWYGNFPLDDDRFAHLRRQFSDFAALMRVPRTA